MPEASGVRLSRTELELDRLEGRCRLPDPFDAGTTSGLHAESSASAPSKVVASPCGRSGLYLTEVPSGLMQAIVQLIGDRRASCSTPRRWLQTSPSGKPTWRSWEEHLRQRVAMSTNVDLLRRIIIERVFNRGDLSVAGEVCAHGFVSISIYYRRSYPVPRFSRSKSNMREARFVISPDSF